MVLTASIPDKRLFHIDRECYILYIGTDPRDEKPFIRIGAGEGLPAAVLPEIGMVIAGPAFTGNPCRERENLDGRRPEATRYIGDGDVVRSYRRFLELMHLSSVHVQDFTELGSGGHRSIVTFYDDGNFTLSCDGGVIFDLFRRERSDRHFIRVAEDLSRKLESYPYAYSDSILNRPGLFISGGSVFLTNADGITAYGLPDRFHIDLFQYGIDPDRIAGVVSGTVSDEVVNWLKRRRAGGRCFLRTQEANVADELSSLFSVPELEIKSWNSAATEGALSPECRFRFTAVELELVTRAFKGKNAVKFLVSESGAEYRIGEHAFFIPSGIPFLLESSDAGGTDLFSRFIAPIPDAFRESLEPEAYRYCLELAEVCRKPGTDIPQMPAVPVTGRPSVLPYFMQNCRAFSLHMAGKASGGLEKSRYLRLQDDLRNQQPGSPGVFRHLPLYGLFDTGTGLPFFTSEREVFVSSVHERHLGIVEAERSVFSARLPFFVSERERLQNFVRELEIERRRPKASAAKSDSSRITAVPEPEPAPVQAPGRQDSERLSWKTIEPAAQSGPVFRKPVRKRRSSGTDLRKVLRATVPAAAIVLLVSGGFLVWSRMKSSVRDKPPVEERIPADVLREEPDTTIPAHAVQGLPSDSLPADSAELPNGESLMPTPGGIASEEPRTESDTGTTVRNSGIQNGRTDISSGDGRPGPGASAGPRVPDPGIALTSPVSAPASEPLKPLVLAGPAPKTAAQPAVRVRENAAGETRSGDTPVRLPVTSPAPSLMPEEEPAARAEPVPSSDVRVRPAEVFVGSFGSIQISEADVLELARRIAWLNGEEIGEGVLHGVHGTALTTPGRTLILPDGERYAVRTDDTLRSVTLDALRRNIEKRYGEYDRLRKTGKSVDLLLGIELIRQRSWCEEFIRMMDDYRKTVEGRE